jgi:hypothetical protein
MPSLAEMLAAQKAAKENPVDTKTIPAVADAQQSVESAADKSVGTAVIPVAGVADGEPSPGEAGTVRVNPLLAAAKRNPLLGPAPAELGIGGESTVADPAFAARPVNPLLRVPVEAAPSESLGSGLSDGGLGDADDLRGESDPESPDGIGELGVAGDAGDGGSDEEPDSGDGYAGEPNHPAPARLSLESLSATTISGGRETPEQLRAKIRAEFPDQVPADAPLRDLEGADEGLRDFCSVLDGIYDRLIDPDLFGKMVRTIMVELQEHPQYMQQVSDHDKARLMEGLRASMGEIRQVKSEKKEKRGTSATAKAKVSEQRTAVASKVLGKLAGLGIG